MLKEKIKKHTASSKKSSNTSIYFLLCGALSGILLFILTRQILLFAISMVLSFSSYLLFFDNLSTMPKEKEAKKEIADRIEFFSSFYEYSALTNSYQEGFHLAFESMGSSHLKDKITDYLENEEGILDISYTHSQKETHILDKIIRYYKNQEEVDYTLLASHQKEIEEYKKEGDKKIDFNLTTCLLLLLIWSFFFFFASFRYGK